MVAVASVLDGLDGIVARRFALCGRFGCNLDSLADLVTFGVVPALMLREGPLATLPVLGAAAGLLFVLGGAWRLARFPLVEDRDWWVGLPIPCAGLIAVAAAVLDAPAGLALAVAVALALLMISTVPFPTLVTLAQLFGVGGAADAGAPVGPEAARVGGPPPEPPPRRRWPRRPGRLRRRRSGEAHRAQGARPR